MANETREQEPEGTWQYALYLTREERRLLLTVAGIVLLGLSARYWHLRGQSSAAPPPVAPSATVQEDR